MKNAVRFWTSKRVEAGSQKAGRLRLLKALAVACSQGFWFFVWKDV